MFVIEDEGPTASVLLPARWSLVARDAFNGLLLWKQPIGKWESHLRKFRSGPTHLPRRLVADGPRVYVTLGYGAPVTAHDAATGQAVKTYAGTEGADEIVLCDGVLYVVRHDAERAALWAIQADSGKEIWKKQGIEMAGIATQTLAVGRQLYAQIGKEIVSWERATGRQLWRVARVPAAKAGKGRKGGDLSDGSRTPTLVVWQDVVLSADASELVALDAADGRQLWTAPTGYGYQTPIDVFVADGLVWTGTGMGKVEKVAGRDPRSGAVRKELDTGEIYRNPGMTHHRCYRNKATDRFLVLGRAGVELLDLHSGDTEQNNWVRGVCQYGVVPCNGMIYVPPHACGCYLQAKLNGFYALAPKRGIRDSGLGIGGKKAEEVPRLETGSAYTAISYPQSLIPSPSDWPTYRHDAARSGSTAVPVPTTLKPAWQSALGGKPSAPVMAEGKVFVAVPETHVVCALSAADGKLAWRFTAGGRVDSPPTIYGGMVLFGCADGRVYCLRAGDGELVWRWRAAPEDRRTVVHEQLESIWPVHGSVLVRQGQVWFAVGRSTFLDGGIRLVRLDAATGKLLGETVLDSRDPRTGKQPPIGTDSLLDAALADVLSSDASTVFMRHNSFDANGKPAAKAPHLFSPLGFLDDSWWARGYFTWSDDFSTAFTGWAKWPGNGNRVPSGQILVCNAQTVYGFSRRKYGNQWPVNYDGENVTEGREYVLFAAAKDAKPAPRQPMAGQGKPVAGRKGGGKKGNSLADSPLAYQWCDGVPLTVRSLVLAGDVLFAAGPPDLGPADKDRLATWEGKQGGLLAAFSTHDGKPLGQWKLDALPVWDSLIAAEGRLFLSTADGQVRCFAGPVEESSSAIAAPFPWSDQVARGYK